MSAIARIRLAHNPSHTQFYPCHTLVLRARDDVGAGVGWMHLPDTNDEIFINDGEL